MGNASAYEDLTLTGVTVTFDDEGTPEECHASFMESSGMAFFKIRGNTAEYDGHVHSVDRDKAKRAVSNLPFIEDVDMTYNPRSNE